MNKTPKEAIKFELECGKITQLINIEVLEALLPSNTDDNVLKQIRDEIKKCNDVLELLNKKLIILEGMQEATA